MKKNNFGAGLIFSGLVCASLLSGCLGANGVSSSSDSAALRSSGGGAPPDPDAKGTGKVDVCHIPPGNPANAHTITVGSPAVRAHLDHGDVLGACVENVTPPTGPVTDPETTPETDPSTDPETDPVTDPVTDPGTGSDPVSGGEV